MGWGWAEDWWTTKKCDYSLGSRAKAEVGQRSMVVWTGRRKREPNDIVKIIRNRHVFL